MVFMEKGCKWNFFHKKKPFAGLVIFLD